MDDNDEFDSECYEEACGNYADSKRDEEIDKQIFKDEENCDNCKHSYICGSRLACGLTKIVTVNEHWCIEYFPAKHI